MLGWALMFLLLALVAGAFGFFGVAGASYGFAKVLFFIFLALFVISLFTGRGEVGPRSRGLAR